MRGVPQGSVLGPLLFNIFINDLFFFLTKSEVCNFADDNTIYVCNKNLEFIKENLQYDMKVILQWFRINSMKANPGKFQFMLLGKNRREKYVLDINGILVKESDSVTLLGVTIDNKLRFKQHISKISRSAFYKLRALRRIRNFLTVEKSHILAKAFINSQFNYAALIWMFSGKRNLAKINRIHSRTLKIVFNSFDKSYEELLELSGETTIHQKHLRFLAIEVFKSLMALNPKFMWPFFKLKPIKYDLRKGDVLNLPSAKSMTYGVNSLIFRGSLLWNTLPKSLKTSCSLLEFKRKIRCFGNIQCTCTICR